jgi:dTDP-4-amino-4,6-dideoxygalactose transaminase
MPTDCQFRERIAGSAISTLSRRLLARVETDEIVARRRTNYLRLLSRLRRVSMLRPLFPYLPDGVCPLVMPVLTDDRDASCDALNRQGICAIPWWAGYHPQLTYTGFTEAEYLKEHLIALPVHQDLGPEHIDRIAECLMSLQAHSCQSDGGIEFGAIAQ